VGRWLRAPHATFAAIRAKVQVPELEDLQRGGVVGSVEIVDCVAASDSPWFVGDYGFVLRNPQVLPFTPFKGALGFFDVPRSALAIA
jgi:hypothetical protein